MRPIEIPQAAKDHYEPQGAQERAYGAPPGHEADTDTAWALMIEGLEGQTYGKQVSLPLELSDEDRAAVAEGKPIWLNLAGYSVIPFAITVGDVPPII